MTRHKVTALQQETSHHNSILIPVNQTTLEKNHFLSPKTSFPALNYTPLCNSPVFSQNKKSYVQFFRRLILKTIVTTPVWSMDIP